MNVTNCNNEPFGLLKPLYEFNLDWNNKIQQILFTDVRTLYGNYLVD